MSGQPPDPTQRIRLAADRLFAEAERFSDLTRSRVLELAGGNLGRRAFERVFPGNQFTLLRRAWLRGRIETAMNTVFATARVQRDVTFQKVADLAGCDDDTVKRVAGTQFLLRRAALEDSQERMLQAIQRLVDATIPPHEYTWARVYVEAGERLMKLSDEINRAFRDGLETLVQHHEQQRQQRVLGATYACIQGDWVNVDEMLEALIVQGVTNAMPNVQEYGRVVSWLRVINLTESASDKAYLTEAEFDALLDSCLEDIGQGLAYTQKSGPTVGQKTVDIHAEDAVAVLHWGVALIILVMAFTGLRRQSIARLTVDDIAQNDGVSARAPGHTAHLLGQEPLDALGLHDR